MADVVEAETADGGKPARRGGKGLILGLLAGVALGGGGFYAVWSGLVDPAAMLAHEARTPAGVAVAYVAMEPVMISLPPGASARHLRFTGQLEVEPDLAPEVAHLMPRVLDTLNTYLRAVDVADLENPAALAKLRAQMLRRVQVVTGEGRVRDLLVTEFVLN